MSHPLDPSNPLDMGIFPRVPRDQWPQPRRIPAPTRREMQMQAYQTGAVPRGGGRGWQAGGAVGYQGGGRPVDTRYAAYEARKRNAPPPQERIRFEGPDWPRPRGGDRPPGDWQEGGVVDYASNFAPPWHRDADPSEADPSESLMAERESLQQLLQQTTDEVMAQEILMRIREITKELEMDARNFGMANGGIASLMGI